MTSFTGVPEESGQQEEPMRRLLKVASWSIPGKVAGAIAGVIRNGKLPEVQAIGPLAVNQAIKAVAVARSYLAEEDIELICIPELMEVIVGEDLERTAIKLTVEQR